MRSILVTGGSGLVGKALEEIHQNYKPDYYFIFLDSKQCDLKNYTQTEKLFKYIAPDIVIHLAAQVGGLYKNINKPVKMIEDNLLINTNVLRASHEAGVNTLLACLSTCIFPDQSIETFTPINEKMLHEGPPHPSNEGYAYAKRMLDLQCKSYKKQFNRNYFCIIPTNIYGPDDNYNLEDAHVIPGLIHRCFLAKKDKIPFIIKGTGIARRQFIYSVDLATLIMIIINRGISENIILSPSTEHSISEIAELICKKMEYHFIDYDVSFSDGQYKKTSDTSKLLSLIDFEFTPIEEGLSKTIDYFIENYLSLRK
jgi:GDP-L-fucose synthase